MFSTGEAGTGAFSFNRCGLPSREQLDDPKGCIAPDAAYLRVVNVKGPVRQPSVLIADVRNRQFDEPGDTIEVGHRLQWELNPMRRVRSLRMFERIRRMHQAFARDDRSRQVEIEFLVIVKMREVFTAIAESGKAVIASRNRLFFDAKLGKARDQLFA